MKNTLTIHPIPILKDNYVWAIIDNQTKTAIIVDPGEAKPVAAFLHQANLKLLGIIITHHHWDHTNGVAELKAQFNVPVYGPAKENIAALTHPVAENDEVKMGNFPLSLKVLEIPGHTLDHIAYYADGMVFCGDTLFAAGCGRLFEGTAQQMYQSLQKLAHLPLETKVYCAHEYTASNLGFAQAVEPHNEEIAKRIETVAAIRQQNLPSLPSSIQKEKATNPFLRTDIPDVITATEKFSGEKLSDPVSIFAAVRKWKDGF